MPQKQPFAMVASRPAAPVATVGDVEQAIRDDFSTIPEILSIDITHENGEVVVRLAANDPPKEIRYKIYDKQASIIRAFPEVDLDFNLIPVG